MQLGLTGATGFVGRHLITAAVRRGYEVVAFSRRPERPVHDCVETRRFSIDAPPDFRGCQAVIHLAGESIAGIFTSGKKRRILQSRVAGTRQIVAGLRALAQPPEIFVCASAVGYYADGGEAELTEASPSGGNFLAEVCRAWEKEAMEAEPICRTVRARFGLVLGRDGGPLPPLRRLFRLGLGGRLGHGRQWMPWIHVEDLVSLLLFAVENLDLRGPVNGTAPWPVRNADFTRALAAELHRPAFCHAPAWALRLFLRDFAPELLDSRRVVPAAVTAAGFPFRHPEIAPALRAILA
jgi:uncharacterized protein (TIGR01777 family)